MIAQLRRSEEMLQAEKADHQAVQASPAEATTTIRQLQERVAGLNTRLSEHEAHARSRWSKNTLTPARRSNTIERRSRNSATNAGQVGPVSAVFFTLTGSDAVFAEGFQ